MGLFSGKCLSSARLDGRTAVITGANTGIGKETAKDFFVRGARVILACRNLEKADKAVEDIKNEIGDEANIGQLDTVELNLNSFKSVNECAKKLLENEKRIDLLINNAGVMMCPQGKTDDGNEIQFQSNHLGHFLLTLLLLPKIANSTPARIVNVSSVAHVGGNIDFDDINFEKRKYSSITAYRQSKLANILFTQELVRKLEEWKIENINVYSLHPGVIRTELSRHLDTALFSGFSYIWSVLSRAFTKTPLQGAQTTIYCAVDEKCQNETGLYYAECKVTKTRSNSINIETAEKLWDVSLEMVGLENDYKPQF